MRKGKKRWINALQLDEGSFSAKAKRAGKSTQEYAREKQRSGGKLQKQAVLALTFSKMRKRKKAR